MLSEEIAAEISTVAAEIGVEPAALLAVAEVESGGRAYAVVDGQREPLIRFEGHYFDRRLSGKKRAHARASGLAAPGAGVVANPRTQAARWRLLTRACTIDRQAALESVSWGLGQVMGAHWAWLGYADVGALVTEARSGVAGQARLMARYIEKAGLAGTLRARDWAAFALGYNGPGYRRHAYDTKMARAYRRYSGRFPQGRTAAPRLLRRGSSGTEVAGIQERLVVLGHALMVDGVFGKSTEAAVRRFQRDHGLVVDGIVGPATHAALRVGRAGVEEKEAGFWSGLFGRLFNTLRTRA